MRVILQRVSKALVSIEGANYSQIDQGLLILLGITHEDSKLDIDWLVQKIINLRIFSDENGKMNLSILEVKWEVLVVSQFTLFASTKKGNRPSFVNSAKSDKALALYEKFVDTFKSSGILVQTGVFGANMQVELINDGPVTLILDSKNKE
jgi:D-tyrosyl-tRNA(Tyr) deacylase